MLHVSAPPARPPSVREVDAYLRRYLRGFALVLLATVTLGTLIATAAVVLDTPSGFISSMSALMSFMSRSIGV